MGLLPSENQLRGRFDHDTFRRIVHYVCWIVEDPRFLDLTRLNRILWYTERNFYLSTGRLLTGATYTKQHDAPQARPLAPTLLELEKSGDVVARRATPGSALYFALSKPDLSTFPGDVISNLDAAIRDICFGVAASIPNRQAHDRILRAASVGEVLPHYTSLAGNQTHIDAADLNWALRKIESSRSRGGCPASDAPQVQDSRVEEACRALEWYLSHEPSAGISLPTSRKSYFIYRQIAATQALPDIVALYELDLNELIIIGLRIVWDDDEDDTSYGHLEESSF